MLHILYLYTDRNECERDTGGCEQLCINTLGSWYCACHRGYMLSVDGVTCQSR